MAEGHRERREACLTAASTAPGSNKAGHRDQPRCLRRRLSLPVSRYRADASRFGFVGWSIPTEAARRHDCLKLAEIEFADRAQCFGGRGILKVVRQGLQPGDILSLKVRETRRRCRSSGGRGCDDRLDGGCGSRPARHGIAPGAQRPSWLFHL